MRAQVLLVLTLLMVGSCAARQKPQAQAPMPERYILPFGVDPDAVFCVQQFSGSWHCIHVSDLRKLLGSMGKA